MVSYGFFYRSLNYLLDWYGARLKHKKVGRQPFKVLLAKNFYGPSDYSPFHLILF